MSSSETKHGFRVNTRAADGAAESHEEKVLTRGRVSCTRQAPK